MPSAPRDHPITKQTLDYISANERKDIPPLISIRQNSTIGFEVVGYKNPDQFRASFYQPGQNGDLIDASNNGALRIILPKGTYYLTVAAGWNNVGDFSNVFQVKIECVMMSFEANNSQGLLNRAL